MSHVVAVIPTLGRDIPRLQRAVNSVREHTIYKDLQIIVINNSGSDDLESLIGADLVLSFGINLGNVGSIEYVRRHYPCEYFWIIQDDMVLLNDVLAELMQVVESNQNIAAASPVILRNGVIPARTRAGKFNNSARTRWENFPLEDVTPDELDTEQELCFVAGSGALYRSSCLTEVGGFNLNLYPLIHVDVDVCMRFLRHDWRVHLVPTAHIEHQINGSTNRLLVEVLHRNNTAYLEGLLESDFYESKNNYSTIDPDILWSVARRGSYLFLDISKEGQHQINELREVMGSLQDELNDERATRSVLQDEVANYQRLLQSHDVSQQSLQHELKAARMRITQLRREKEQLLHSTSWKITKPLRRISSWMRIISRQK